MNSYPNRSKSKKLFAVVQGANFPALRKRSAKDLLNIGFDGYGFGGWPVDSQKNLATDILKLVADLIPKDTPKYAMGVGTPENIIESTKLGYNLFDCVIPTRNARHGLLYTQNGEVRITQSQYGQDTTPIDPECSCELCRNYTKAYLHHLFRTKETTAKTLATIHNLTHYSELMKTLV